MRLAAVMGIESNSNFNCSPVEADKVLYERKEASRVRIKEASAFQRTGSFTHPVFCETGLKILHSCSAKTDRSSYAAEDFQPEIQKLLPGTLDVCLF